MLGAAFTCSFAFSREPIPDLPTLEHANGGAPDIRRIPLFFTSVRVVTTRDAYEEDLHLSARKAEFCAAGCAFERPRANRIVAINGNCIAPSAH
eukprot:scaffold1098_cov417-Prasinococcus_capsulatus_cf.AAC.13